MGCFNCRLLSSPTKRGSAWSHDRPRRLAFIVGGDIRSARSPWWPDGSLEALEHASERESDASEQLGLERVQPETSDSGPNFTLESSKPSSLVSWQRLGGQGTIKHRGASNLFASHCHFQYRIDCVDRSRREVSPCLNLLCSVGLSSSVRLLGQERSGLFSNSPMRWVSVRLGRVAAQLDRGTAVRTGFVRAVSGPLQIERDTGSPAAVDRV